MSFVSEYRDWSNATPSIFFTDPGDFITDAAKQTWVLNRFIAGRRGNARDMLQSGQFIKDMILLNDQTTAENYAPGSAESASIVNVASIHNQYWRFVRDRMAWNDQMILLNGGDLSSMTASGRKKHYKSIRKLVEQAMWVSLLNKLENNMWTNPHDRTGFTGSAEMEGAGGVTPFSIPAYLNENTNGLPSSWTTVQGLSPTTESGWRSPNRTYNYADPFDLDDSSDGLLDAFDAIASDCRFDVAPYQPGQFDKNETMPMSAGKFIACSPAGSRAYKKALRESNANLVTPQDSAYLRPKYAGADVEEIVTLTDAALYTDGSTGWVSELSASASKKGWRYYLIDTDILRMFFHEQKFFADKDAQELPLQRETTVQPVYVWYNLFCRSKKRIGLVSPA